MAEFYVPITNEFFASQIAELLNKHNKLTVVHNTNTILASNTRYFVELVSAPAIEKRVVGCVGLEPYEPQLSRIKHVSTDPTYRRFGVARRLIDTALANCPTEYVFMTIREDNVGSFKLAESLGFVFVRKDWKKDHFVITVGRRK